jgi:lipoprotein NlpI
VSRQIFWRISGESRARPVTPNETVEDGIRKLVFEERSMAKVDLEPLTPLDYPAYRMLHFSEFEGWDGVVAWAADLFRSKGVTSQALRDVIETLKKGATEEERVVGALEFVQSQIRYFSVSLGESSHRPTQPDMVLERRYGDCKDKSLLLITMLEALGVQSRPVLLYLGKRRGLDGALPSPLQFNHVIVEASVGGKVFYLDPTHMGQHGLLRRMGQLYEGTQVLVVSPQTRGPTTVAANHAPQLLHSETTETAVLPKFGADAELVVRQIWRGAVAEAMRVGRERTPDAEIVKNMAGAMDQRYPGARLIGDPDIVDDRVNNVLSITGRYSVPKFAQERAGTWFVRYLPVNVKGTLSPAPPSARTAPLLLPLFPYAAKYTFEIKFPDEVSAVNDLRTEAVRGKYFTYAVSSSFRGNVAKTTVEFRTLSDQVKVADLKKYAEDVRAVANIVVGVIVVPKNVRRPAASARAAKQDLGKTLKKRLSETIEASTLAIKSGKLGDADLARSYCLRSSARGELGHAREAVSDAKEAVKLTPNSSDSFGCRAYAYLTAGKFEESIADFSTAISLGATDSHTLERRGIAKFYAKKLEEAAEDFARASEMGDATPFGDLWLAWTHQRLGRPLPAALLERAKAGPRSDWPRPALAVLTGDLDPDEMLKLLARKGGDDRVTALAEGYFYLGQYYLARGDKARAREFFEKTRRQNVVVYLEHMAAGFELQALGPAAETGSRPPPAADANPQAPEATAKKKSARRQIRKAAEDWTVDFYKK